LSRTITLETTLELHNCPVCGVAYAGPAQLFESRRADHGSFYCPNGHSLSYPQQSDAEKAQAEAEKYKKLWKQEQKYAADVLNERNAAQRSLRATKGVLTRTKNRIANGVCPCCNRSFAQLERHMQTKHPEYTKEETSA
jgi:uncharacterized Zn finger protein (UPF0148 family)